MKGINVRTWLDAKGVKDAVRQAQTPRLARIALEIERQAKLSMKAGGRSTGPRGGKVKKPSAPGTPPHVQTGNLRGSISTALTLLYTYIIGPTSSAWYAQLHEFGLGKFPKRPFMRPALMKIAHRMPQEFRNLPMALTPAGQRLNARRLG
jgi:hypothetical protein